MNEQETLEVLNRTGAVITGSHVVYTSGRHGSVYVNKDALYVDDTATSLICDEIAWQFRNDGAEVVVAPAIGGVILSRRVAHRLAKLTGRKIPGVYAERDETSIFKTGCDMTFVLNGTTFTLRKDDELVVKKMNFVLKRGYDKVVRGKKVLVVEDVLTTGGSAKKVVEAVRATGGEVVGVGVICNRGDVTPANLANPPKLFALVNLTLETYDEADCPLCRDGVPMNTDVGKGKDWLARNADRVPICPECGRMTHNDGMGNWTCHNCGPHSI